MCIKCKSVMEFSKSFARYLDTENRELSDNTSIQIFELCHQAETIMLGEDDSYCIEICKDPTGIILSSFETQIAHEGTFLNAIHNSN